MLFLVEFLQKSVDSLNRIWYIILVNRVGFQLLMSLVHGRLGHMTVKHNCGGSPPVFPIGEIMVCVGCIRDKCQGTCDNPNRKVVCPIV